MLLRYSRRSKVGVRMYYRSAFFLHNVLAVIVQSTFIPTNSTMECLALRIAVVIHLYH